MFTLAKYKSAVTIHDRIDDVSEVVEMITEDVIDSKELSHLWSEGLEIINNRLSKIEERLYDLEEKAYSEGLTKLEYKINRVIKEHCRKRPHTINESDPIQ